MLDWHEATDTQSDSLVDVNVPIFKDACYILRGSALPRINKDSVHEATKLIHPKGPKRHLNRLGCIKKHHATFGSGSLQVEVSAGPVPG